VWQGGEKIDRFIFLWFVWVISTSLGGYHLPFLLDALEFLKVREVKVEGLKHLSPEIFSQALKDLKPNSLVITEERLLGVLRVYSDNAVESVEIKRSFSFNGVSLLIVVKERQPILTAISKEEIRFFDDKGEDFYAPMPLKEPFVYTDDFNPLKERFYLIKELLSLLENKIDFIELKSDRTLGRLKEGQRILLPPVEFINTQTLERLRLVLQKEEGFQEIDLRMESMVIVK